MALGLQVLHRVQDGAVGVGRLQVDRFDQREQRRAVRAVVLFQQRQVVVAVVGGHGLVRGGQGIQAAGLFQRLQYQPSRALGHVLLPGGGLLVRGFGGWQSEGRSPARNERLADAVQDVAEHPQQPLGLGAVGLPELVELVAALAVNRRDPLAEHRHHVVPDPGPRRVQQAHDQHEPLVLVQHLAQIGDIGHARLAREVRDLSRRDALQPHLGRAERVQVPQERQAALELAERRRLRDVLQPVVLAAPRDRVDHQQPAQPRPRRRVHPTGHQREEPAVDLGADLLHQLVQRGVARQLSSARSPFAAPSWSSARRSRSAGCTPARFWT
ncbi:hypothetical protein ABZU75_07145 [Streptosporangium sp. NPDC005286]|uniref:hypothetical protein n=1 Tax=Streptosporangium sp. NPDC005286 TaxID=3154463 RepID=UPI0033B14087